MEGTNYKDIGLDCSNEPDEIEGLNERLLELLRTPPRHVENHARSSDEKNGVHTPNFLHNSKTLAHYSLPIGVFWDIENCRVPRGKSAAAVTQVIRDKFFNGYREAEFIVVCDVNKENKQIIQELNDAQVNLIHVAATYKNAADEKLKQSIRRFADIHGSPAAIVLISSDINFAADLSDLRHRRKMQVILLHNENCSEALILCANQHYNYMELMESLPSRPPAKPTETYDILVRNLPKDKGLTCIKRRLKQLSDNCGGRVIGINSNAAIIRFSLQEAADRAQKRMDGELVFDTRITVRPVKELKKRKPEEPNTSTITSDNKNTKSPVEMYTASSAFVGVRSLPCTPHYHTTSPVIGGFPIWNGGPCLTNPHSGVMSAQMMTGRPYSANADIIYNRPFPENIRSQSPAMWQAGFQQFGQCWEESCMVEMTQNFGKRSQMHPKHDCSPRNSRARTPDGMRRIRGTHSTINHAPEWVNAPIFRPQTLHNGNGFGQKSSFRRRSLSPVFASQNAEGWNASYHAPSNRASKTPSPFGMAGTSLPHSWGQYQHAEVAPDNFERSFNSISSRGTSNNAPNQSIELQVTNLDQNINAKDMRHILYSMFLEHVRVIHVSIYTQSDGNHAACVKVASLQDAQYAISQLHRKKVGHKRILISYAHTEGPNPQLIRSQIVILLQEVPGHKLPLFKFREMYENRFMISVSVSDLYKMKDVCTITEEPGGRMMALNPDHRNTPSPTVGNLSQNEDVDLPYCILHYQKQRPDKGWAEQEVAALPNVLMPLKILRERVHQLLVTHDGSMPLPTLPNCYEAEFRQPLNVVENGVPLEHLISCLPTVEMKQGLSSVKYLSWKLDSTHDESRDEIRPVSPALANQLMLFTREVVDLLKTAPHCQIPFNRFIPAYHHHFGRQCRVADYGFTKLIDLLDALPNVIQVMGEGNKRVVTLAHRAQIRRFTSDLLRVLKSHASKQITLSELPAAFTRVLVKKWDVVDYGVSEIGDILSEVSENTVVVSQTTEGDKLIAIPKRTQTPEEIEKTNQFAIEVVELLRHAPQCSMLFDKFVPSYHHHFGHQCRVSDYGVTKLIELFEAIPNIIKIDDTPDDERRITLTEPEILRILAEQISKLIIKSPKGLLLSRLSQSFLCVYGFVLRPEAHGCDTLEALIGKLGDTLQIVNSPAGPQIELVLRARLQELSLQCRRVLMDQHQLPVEEFKRVYRQYYGTLCKIDEVKKDLSNVVQFSVVRKKEWIKLRPLQIFACAVYRLLMHHGGKISLQKFEAAYVSLFDKNCNYSEYGCTSLLTLLKALPCTIVIKESRQKKKTLFLNRKLAAVGFEIHPTPIQPQISGSDSPVSNSSAVKSEVKQPEVDAWGDESIRSAWPLESEHCDKSELWANTNNESCKWTTPGNGRSFLENLHQSNNSLPEEIDDSGYHWKSSVWATPPKFVQTEATNVNVPPLTLPEWSVDDDAASSLLSPTKNLLPAIANPLNPPTPLFFVDDQVIIAPHPSQLPLPLALSSMTIAPAKEGKCEVSIDSGLLGNSHIHSPNSEACCSFESCDSSNISHNTPNKQLALGKRKLTAQLNQSLD